MPYQYYYDSAASAWIILLDGQEIHRTLTEEDAREWIDQN